MIICIYDKWACVHVDGSVHGIIGSDTIIYNDFL